MEKEMATHSSVLAWRIPGTGSLAGCRLWGRTELDMTEAMQQQLQGKTGSASTLFLPASLFARAYFAFVIRK